MPMLARHAAMREEVLIVVGVIWRPLAVRNGRLRGQKLRNVGMQKQDEVVQID